MEKLKQKAREAAEALNKQTSGTCAAPPPGGAASGSATKSSGVPMKFPYTFWAKVVQFPWKFYYANNWVYKYYVFGVILSIPAFVKIHRLSNSPGNVANWEAIKRKQREAEHH